MRFMDRTNICNNNMLATTSTLAAEVKIYPSERDHAANGNRFCWGCNHSAPIVQNKSQINGNRHVNEVCYLADFTKTIKD